MLKKGNENPFLHGKAPKKHFEFKPVLQPDPFNNLTGERRQEAVRLTGAQSKAEFDKQLQIIRELLGRYNPFQLLAHLCYYDQLVLDGKRGSGYEPVDQCMVEWLQALILMIPETAISQSLDSIPEGDVLTGLNASLHSVQQSYSLMRLGKEHDNNEAAVVAELKGYFAIHYGRMLELRKTLDARIHNNLAARMGRLGYPSALKCCLASIPRRLGAQGNMEYPASGPLGSSRNLPANLAIISNFAVSVFSTKPMRLNSDGVGCGGAHRGPQPDPVAGA